MGTWKPDEIIHHPDGSQEQRRWRRSLGRDQGRCLYIKIIDPDGQTREFWQVAWDGEGREVHRDLKYRRSAQHGEAN